VLGFGGVLLMYYNLQCISFLFLLEVAKEREVEGDLLLGDIGDGVPFQPGTFDGAYSVSTLQWLCNADKSSHKPAKRLYTLFSTLLACLVSSINF